MEFILGPLGDLFDIYIVKIWGKFIQHSWGFVSSRMFLDVGWMVLGLHDPSHEGITFLQDIGNCYLRTALHATRPESLTVHNSYLSM